VARIIGLAPKVHRVLGLGFLESVYQDALARELGKAGLKMECGTMVSGSYDGVVVGGFVCDLLVEGLIPVEDKPVHALVLAHGVQLANYLIANAIEVGLLVNFGAERIEFKARAAPTAPSLHRRCRYFAPSSCQSCASCLNRVPNRCRAAPLAVAIMDRVCNGGPEDRIARMNRMACPDCGRCLTL